MNPAVVESAGNVIRPTGAGTARHGSATVELVQEQFEAVLSYVCLEVQKVTDLLAE
jgi:hypothetical protein